jgi:formamidopyrimidine-DNA glycosylase
MPELPEVETIVRGLRDPLTHRRVLRTRLAYKSLYRHGSLVMRWLVGRTIESVDRVGKNALFRFSPSGLMVVNLGMTGRLVVYSNGDNPLGYETKHLHGQIHLEDDLELRYYDARRFGHFYIAKQCDFARDLNIGPDPFVAGRRYLAEKLTNRSAPIKALLLDQRLLSGLGNIYADETLFYSGIDPRKPGGAARAKARVLLSNATSVLNRAIVSRGLWA